MSRREDLARLLETSRLERVVPRLHPETLHQLIRYRGLEASGDLLAAATREQLSSLLDADLWGRSAAAGDEQFDAARFGEWIETLAETGDALAAAIVSRFDERLVTAGLSSHIRVCDPAAAPAWWMDGEEAGAEEWPPAGQLFAEIGGFLVLARRAQAWDAIVALLVTLEAGHREYFDVVMEGCRRLSDSVPEADGFHELLAGSDQLLHDLGLARQVRRSKQGFLTPSDARALLQLARTRPLGGGGPSLVDRFAARYLGGGEEKADPAAGGSGSAGDRAAPTAQAGRDDEVEAIVELLAEAGLVPERPRALLEAGADRRFGAGHLGRLLAHLREADPPAFAARSRELAFLANVLMEGCSFQARPFTAPEASEAAAGVCNLGLEEWQPPEPQTRGDWPWTPRLALPDTFLADHSLVSLFQRGWAALHEMSLSAADALVAVLDRLRCADVETQVGLHVLRRQLVKHREAGTPWRARDALDVIAVLDLPAWVSLLGVLDECPVLPAALRATLERRTGAISATAFEFISTRRQIDEVRTFMGRLLDILLR